MPFQVNQTSIDVGSGAGVSIDSVHHEIHEGDSYSVYEGIALGVATREYLIVPPPADKEAHFTFSFSSSHDLDIFLYVATTRTGGTSVPVINRNGNSPNTALTTVAHTPGAGDDGTLIASGKIGSPSGPGQAGAGASASSRNEWTLKTGASYLLRLVSATSGSRITVMLDWYEHGH